jgi:hypothetical protein
VQLPSIQLLFAGARSTFVRFPFVIVAALVAAIAAVFSIEGDSSTLVKILVSAQLGFPLFVALGVGGEAFGWSRGVRFGQAVVGLVLLVAYYFTLPNWFTPGAVTRFVQFNVGLHLLVAFLPFATVGRQNAFWQYNKGLFLRFLQSALYSVIIFGGLSIALVAIDKLLGASIDEIVYPRMWFVIALLFNTWMFVGGIPDDVRGLETVSHYPRGLKVISQYVLIPLVIIYLTILTIYLFKVVITTEWPSGWIGYLVSSVAVVGMLALLLVWPVSARAENRWVATYTRWFFIFMIPAIVMLLLAIYKRIDQYGVTENRYFLAVLAVWLAAIALYFIFSRKRNIKLIPATLCLVAFVTSFGPWGAYSVSRKSQMGRLGALLQKNEILDEGAVRKAPGDVSPEDAREISAITFYMVEHHGLESLEPWYGEERLAEIDTTLDQSPRNNNTRAQSLVATMGVEYVASWMTRMVEAGSFHYTRDRGEAVIPLERADYLVNLTKRQGRQEIANGDFVVAWVDTTWFELSDSSGVIISLSMDPLFDQVGASPQFDRASLPLEVMSIEAENDRARLVVSFGSVSGENRDGRRTVSYFNAQCFVTLK